MCIDLSVSTSWKKSITKVSLWMMKGFWSAASTGTAIHQHFNREAGVIIDHPGAARYFREVFDDDWKPMERRPDRRTII